MQNPPDSKLPDIVLPVSEIAAFFDTGNKVCGIVFGDGSGTRYLLPMPATLLAGVTDDLKAGLASIEGVMDWTSRPAG